MQQKVSSAILPFSTRSLDMLNVMTYDMHGSWDDYTAHNSPLYSHAGEKTDDLSFNVVSEQKAWQQVTSNVEPRKTVTWNIKPKVRKRKDFIS